MNKKRSKEDVDRLERCMTYLVGVIRNCKSSDWMTAWMVRREYWMQRMRVFMNCKIGRQNPQIQRRYSRVCWTCWRWHRIIRNPAKSYAAICKKTGILSLYRRAWCFAVFYVKKWKFMWKNCVFVDKKISNVLKFICVNRNNYLTSQTFRGSILLVYFVWYRCSVLPE